MAKKKNKFKKDKKAASGRTQTVVRSNSLIENENNDEIIEEVIEEEEDNDPYKTDKYHHVKADIRKILIILICLIIVLFGVNYLNSHSTVLVTFSNWIYKILNIQAS